MDERGGIPDKMKVTVCQIDPSAGELDKYLSALAEHIRSGKSDFLLLPEMGFHDWLAADKTPDRSRWMKSVAQHDAYIKNLKVLGAKAVLGTRPIVNDRGSFRNLAYLWSAETDTAAPLHEKYYLPDDEDYWERQWYDRGLKQFDTGRAAGMRIGVQICTEMWFFEWARHYAASYVDILCIPRATPHGTTEKWLAGGRAAAVCSGSYCLSSNLWCPPGSKANCGGLGWVVDPEGIVLARTSEQDPFATVEIDLSVSRRSKTTYPRYVEE